MGAPLQAEDIVHHPTCRADYPEKDLSPGEPAQACTAQPLGDGYEALTCVDCGASVTNLPPEGDPYWDDVRAEMTR